MNAGLPVPIFNNADVDSARAREIDATLTAIAQAIATGTLPPDDAAAWARIAAFEVGAGGGEVRSGSERR